MILARPTSDPLDHLRPVDGVGLNRHDLLKDVVGCPGGLLVQALDLEGDHREALADASGLDRSVERQHPSMTTHGLNRTARSCRAAKVSRPEG